MQLWSYEQYKDLLQSMVCLYIKMLSKIFQSDSITLVGVFGLEHIMLLDLAFTVQQKASWLSAG